MKAGIHILHLEDDPRDATLIEETLRREGIECAITLLEEQIDFLAALEREDIDLVLSDFNLPSFDGFSAISAVRARRPGLPVILVSGTMGEESAIDSLKSGATDYVLKDNLNRLGPAVRRAMQEVADRAERQRLEAQFIEAQKMEVIGQLAGGVAHDFNNVLMIIMGYGNMVSMQLPNDSPLSPLMREILLAADRAAGLTRQLLVCSRNETVQPIVLDLNDAVIEVEQMLRRLIGENIQMSVVVGAEGGNILADSGYIGQVLMNLVVNARDAMPNGGKLEIATRQVTIARADLPSHLQANGVNFVQLRVSDTGTGMTEAVKARLFEAFFTTKPVGKGTGLGLATCNTIVQLSGGFIEVQTELGKGTTFEVSFPRIERVKEKAVKISHHSPLPRGTETVLVVEDEPSVRNLACKVLREQGYEVLVAANGHEGLQVVRAHQGSPLRLVVTDVIMPEMSGRVMAEWLKTIHPDLSILFTTGYTDDLIFQTGMMEAGVELLPKPYTPGTLLHKVRAMLDSDALTGQSELAAAD